MCRELEKMKARVGQMASHLEKYMERYNRRRTSKNMPPAVELVDAALQETKNIYGWLRNIINYGKGDEKLNLPAKGFDWSDIESEDAIWAK